MQLPSPCLRAPRLPGAAGAGADLHRVRRGTLDPRGRARCARRPPSRASPATVGTGSALDTPPVVGTVARFEFDRDRPDSWHLGAAGTPEMRQRLGEVYYEVMVAMDGGERRTVERRDGNRFYVGQRVALRSGELEPM